MSHHLLVSPCFNVYSSTFSYIFSFLHCLSPLWLSPFFSVTVHLPVCLSRLSVCLSFCEAVGIPFSLSFCVSVYLRVCLSISLKGGVAGVGPLRSGRWEVGDQSSDILALSVCVPVLLFVCVRPSIGLSVSRFICLSVGPFVCLSV